MVQQTNEVEVEALPTDLPEHFEVDIANLTEVNQFIAVSDLKYDKTKIEIKEDPTRIIVKIEEVKEEKEEVPVPEATAEGEVAAEGEAAEPEKKEEVKEATSESTSEEK